MSRYKNTKTQIKKFMVGIVEYYKNWGNILTLCYIIVNVFVNIVYSTAITIELNERLSVLARRAI